MTLDWSDNLTNEDGGQPLAEDKMKGETIDYCDRRGHSREGE